MGFGAVHVVFDPGVADCVDGGGPIRAIFHHCSSAGTNRSTATCCSDELYRDFESGLRLCQSPTTVTSTTWTVEGWGACLALATLGLHGLDQVRNRVKRPTNILHRHVLETTMDYGLERTNGC